MSTQIPSIAYWKQAFAYHGARCVYCPTEISPDFTESLNDYLMSSIDHLVPSTLDGANHPDNIVPSCIVCNFYKKDLVPQEFSSLTEIRKEDQKRYVRTIKVEKYISKMKVIIGAEKEKQRSKFEEFQTYIKSLPSPNPLPLATPVMPVADLSSAPATDAMEP